MKCRLCGSVKLRPYYHQGSQSQYLFYKCLHCKLVNLDLENVDIISNQQKYPEQFNPPANYEMEISARKAYEFIVKYVPVKGSYLEIGCGNGALLYFARKDGWIVKGLELSPVLANFVKEKLDIEVDVQNFLETDYKTEQYDLISLRHVLEHLPDSLLAMKKLNMLLKKDGYAHFEFPNIESLSHRLQRFRDKIGFKKQYSVNYFPAHCNEFCKDSFKYLLSKSGFKLIRWETYSSKFFSNLIYNHIHIGTKARAIVQKI